MSMIACKTVGSSTLQATPDQKEALRRCIVKTIKESYARTVDTAAVNAFADDFIESAPSDSSTAKDRAFERYVNSIGCDPSQKAASGTYGITIVEAWAVSSFNPDNAQLKSK